MRLATALGADFPLVRYVNAGPLRLVLLSILALKKLLLHVFSAVDQHGFAVFLTLFLLT